MYSLIKSEQIRSAAVQVLDELKVPMQFKGYAYLVDTIEFVVLNADALKSLDKTVYPVIAEKYGVRVVAIRNAQTLVINEAFNDMSNDLLWDTFEKYIGYHTGSVSAKAFIKVCAERTNKKLRS